MATLNTVRRPRRRSRSTARSRPRLLREIAIDGEIAIFASSRRLSRSRSSRDRNRRRDRDLREIAPSIAISIRFARSRSTASRGRGLEIAINDSAGSTDWRSRTRTGDRGLEIAINDGEIAAWRSRSSARALSLSLSLIFRKHFEGKIEV